MTLNSSTERSASGTQTLSAEQLSAARMARWHQDETPLLTLESLREWLNRSGLVLYGPRMQQLGSPAPSLVEVTLGKAAPAPAPGEMEVARTLLARLVAEGSAVPLNLLGASGATGTDVPDFVASASVFSYIFTLRGNKAWKQAPETSGPVKVSPLALAAYEMLAAKVALSAYDLTTQLGKEVTEAAVLRALTELWSQMRVIPVPQTDGSATLWELASSRFTKQIKSGANAGQPTALSALISLYLGQAMVATEDEVETFLSPLAPRSRVRGVLHDLLGARQLDTLVIAGKTLLHVAGDLPSFAAAASELQAEDATPPNVFTEEGGSRIKKFVARPGSKIGTGLRSKPRGKTGFGGKPAFAKKQSFGARAPYGRPADERPASERPARADRERRPFQQADKPPFATPTFNKPWEEEKVARSLSAHADEQESERESARPERPAGRSMPNRSAPNRSTPSSFAARAGGDRSNSGGGFGGERRRGGPGARGSAAGESRSPRHDFSARPEGAGADHAGAGRVGTGRVGTGARKTFSKPGTFGRKRESFGGGSSSEPGEGRPPRRESGGAAGSDRGDRGRAPLREPRAEGERGAHGQVKRPGSYSPRPRSEASGSYASGGGSKPSFGARAAGARPAGARPASTRPAGARPGGAGRGPSAEGTEDGAPRKVFRKFDAPRDKKPFGAKSFGTRSAGPNTSGRERSPSARPRGAGDASRSFAGPRGGGGAGGEGAPRTPGRASSGREAGGGSDAKKRSAKASGFAKAGGPFAKFAEGKKPFRKPGPGKKTDRGSGGGFTPTKRKRPEGK